MKRLPDIVAMSCMPLLFGVQGCGSSQNAAPAACYDSRYSTLTAPLFDVTPSHFAYSRNDSLSAEECQFYYVTLDDGRLRTFVQLYRPQARRGGIVTVHYQPFEQKMIQPSALVQMLNSDYKSNDPIPISAEGIIQLVEVQGP